jgi:hypothetical protein
MNSHNTKVPIIIISVLIILFSFSAWLAYKYLAVEEVNPLQAFPHQTAFVFEIPQPEKFIKELNNENKFWSQLLQNKNIAEINDFFTVLLNQAESDKYLKSLLKNPFYFSSIKVDEQKSELLFISKSKGLSLESLNTRFFSKLINYRYHLSKNQSDFAELKSDKSTLFLHQYKGLLFVSTSENVLHNAHNQLLEPKLFIESGEFNQLKLTSGIRADAYLYLNFTGSNPALHDSNQPKEKDLSINRSLANFSVLDVILKNEEILLNGYTSSCDTLNQYLSAFKNQNGKTSQLAHSLPYSTEHFISFNLSDYISFIKKQTANPLNNIQKNSNQINKLINKNCIETTSLWFDGEMALVVDEKQREFAVITAKSQREAFRLLSEIAHLTQPKIITEDYREQKIKEINSPDFLKSQFGTLFSSFNEVYFCVIDEAVIFSKSLDDLKSYIDAIILGNNLSKNEAYIDFSDNLADDATISMYSKSANPYYNFIKQFTPDGSELFAGLESLSTNTKGFGIQISNKNDFFYTGLFIAYGDEKKEKSSSWQIELEAKIAAGPFLVKNHQSQGHFILVQDEYNTLYLINEKGDIVWTQLLSEKIISEVYEVDFHKNGNWQYAFNTLNFIHLIDASGNPLANYPIQLKSEASNGMQLLDYERKKEYRILVACKNGELYNYDINGILLSGWQAENTRKEITKPTTHLVAIKKDFLIFEASNGNIIMTDRRGAKRMEIRQSFTNALGSDLYINRTNSKKGLFLTTDTEGNLIYIPETGSVNKTSFGKKSEHHFFLYNDFDKNAVMDFIYLDKNQLRIYDNFKRLLLTYDFKHSIELKPKIFELNEQPIMGIVDKKDNLIYFFDKNGIINEKTRKGNTHFEVGKLEKNATESLIIGLDNSLFNYPLD